MNFRKFTEIVGDAALPSRYRRYVLPYLEKASIYTLPYFAIGLIVYFLLAMSVFISIIVLSSELFSNVPLFFIILISLFAVIITFSLLTVLSTFLVYIYLSARILRKVHIMEDLFPEFLAEFSINMKAGLTLESSLRESLEDQFGPLTDEMRLVVKKISLGADADTAINEFTGKFDSEIIAESFDLIITSWKKGANTPRLVDRIVKNMEESRFLKRKIIASVTSYRIFLATVTILITPAMFALSYYLIDLIRSITSGIQQLSNNVAFPIAIQAVQVNDQHFSIFSVLALILISVCSAMIISIVNSGSIREGYKQMMIYSGGAVIAYKIFMFLFGIFFAWFKF